MLSGDIAQGAKFRVRLCCADAHPGVCRTRDRACYDKLVQVGKAVLKHVVDTSPTPRYLRFVVSRGDMSELPGSLVVYCAHIRLRGPKLALFVARTENEGTLCPVVESGKLVIETHMSLLQRLPGVGSQDPEAWWLQVPDVTACSMQEGEPC